MQTYTFFDGKYIVVTIPDTKKRMDTMTNPLNDFFLFWYESKKYIYENLYSSVYGLNQSAKTDTATTTIFFD